jgi:hypothetical protein
MEEQLNQVYGQKEEEIVNYEMVSVRDERRAARQGEPVRGVVTAGGRAGVRTVIPEAGLLDEQHQERQEGAAAETGEP